MATTTQEAAKRHYQQGERYHLYVIRRGWDYWTGTKWALGVYEARCYALAADARDVIDRRVLADGSDPVEVVACVMTIGAPEE